LLNSTSPTYPRVLIFVSNYSATNSQCGWHRCFMGSVAGRSGYGKRSLYSQWQRKADADSVTGCDRDTADRVCNVQFHSGRSSPSLQRVSASQSTSWYSILYHHRSIITAHSTVVCSRHPGTVLRTIYWDVMVVDDEMGLVEQGLTSHSKHFRSFRRRYGVTAASARIVAAVRAHSVCGVE